MSDRGDWVYCRLVDRAHLILPRARYWVGHVELTTDPEHDAGCVRALQRSMSAYAVAASGEGWSRLIRARVLQIDVTDVEARREGSAVLQETITIFNTQFAAVMTEVRATEAGYLMNLRTRRCKGLVPAPAERRFGGMAGMMDVLAFPTTHTANMLLAAPHAYGELGSSFRRGAHWRELAESSDDQGERLLLHWMAAECLCKLARDDVIVSKLMAVSGFPTGTLARRVSSADRSAMKALPTHKAWRKVLTDLFDKLRVARNRIVHAGFRHVDVETLMRPDELRLGLALLPVLTRRLGEIALDALNEGARTVAEMWGRYPHIMWRKGLVEYATWMISRLESLAAPSAAPWWD